MYTEESSPPQDKYWTSLLEALYLAKDSGKPEQVLSTSYLVTLCSARKSDQVTESSLTWKQLKLNFPL